MTEHTSLNPSRTEAQNERVGLHINNGNQSAGRNREDAEAQIIQVGVLLAHDEMALDTQRRTEQPR